MTFRAVLVACLLGLLPAHALAAKPSSADRSVSFSHQKQSYQKYAFLRGGLTGPPSAAFTGFLDTYSGATWYVSCAYKSVNAYSSTCGTVQRQSDNATQAISFLSNGKGDVATFNSFCAGTNCYLTSWVDQVNGINASQATLANMPRAYVNANGNIAVCPQATSYMTTSFNSAVNTAKQHLFAVAKPGFADSNWNQADLPTFTVTGNITASSTAIGSMSSQVGLSTANQTPNTASLPGVIDSSGFLPNTPTVGTVWRTFLSALPTGTTGTLAFSNGTATTTGSKTGDTLTFTNAVQGGPWISNGPASSTVQSSAYWGAGLAVNLVSSDWEGIKNGTGQNFQAVIGEGMRGAWGVYDYDTFTGILEYNGVSFGAIPSGPTGNITYSTNTGMTLFANSNGTQNAANNCFETMALFPATETARIAMAQFLMAQDAISFPFAPATSDGFTMTGLYQPNDTGAPNTVYGQKTYTDIFGNVWVSETGGYTWPSAAFANNINNSTTLWRFIDKQGDSDEVETNAERAEISINGANTSPGHDFSFADYVMFELFPTQTGSWAYWDQIHFDLEGGGQDVPDIGAFLALNGQSQYILNCCAAGSTPAQQNCGAAFTVTPGVVYAVIGTGHWSATGTSDTFTLNVGPIGTTPIPQLCSMSGSLWVNGTSSAYKKAGFYRGFPLDNAGTIIERVLNSRWNPTTANAFSSEITSPMAVPTHMFLLKRDLDPASNDNDPMWLEKAA